MRRLFPRKLLSEKSFAVALLFTILTSLSLGSAIFIYLHNNKLASVSSEHRKVLSKTNQIINKQLGDIRNSTVLINNHIIDLLKVDNNSAAHVFAHVGKDHRSISQMRWLYRSGHEKIRVNFSENGYDIVSHEQLQNKNSRYYFKEAKKIKNGEVYLSPFDINMEN